MSKHYHFIGIGGIGMGAIASLLLARKYRVSGSDLKESAMTADLRSKGATVFIGHDPGQVGTPDAVVVSSAIDKENVELLQARRANIPVLKRAEVLAEMMSSQKGITVAGAHGKTTTTAMIAHVLNAAGLNPTSVVGGIVHGSDHNARLGGGGYFIAEVDESDGTFLLFSPQYSVITNMDFEHPDYYDTWEKLVDHYARFIRRTAPEGMLFIGGDDQKLLACARGEGRSFRTFGLSAASDVYARDIKLQAMSSSFQCYQNGQEFGPIELQVPGRHNVLNALACLSLCRALDVPWNTAAGALKTFKGVRRRFQVKADINGILVIDDYAHHPTEVRTTLSAAQALQRSRVVAVFQPHRYSRAKIFEEDFAKSLVSGDYIIITDIYAASEKPLPGITAEKIVARAKNLTKRPVEYCKKEDILRRLTDIVNPGDCVLMMGAGDISQIAEAFAENLKKQYA